MEVLSASVTGTSVYKSKISRNARDFRRMFSWVHVFTGTMTGSVVLEGSNSDDTLLDYDKDGGTDTTDKATWVPVFVTFSSSNTPAASKAISGAVTDSVLPTDTQTYKAYRWKFTNASNSGTVSVRVYNTRR